MLLRRRSLWPLFLLVMALAGYKFGQVGARQVPYAYFLLGSLRLLWRPMGLTNPGRLADRP